MEDKFKHDPVGVDSILARLKQQREKYQQEITTLANLASEINTSSSWKDVNVKTEFINTYNSYLNIYKTTYANMASHEKYLEEKSDMARQIEQKYAR
ncbi:MAG: hypothetical protein PUE33_04870 [bacterium]|nr:hypothetical protein [bacterium]